MKQFFKFTFASILGVFIAGLVIFIVFLLLIVSSLSESTYTSESKTILHLKLEGDLVEYSQGDPLKLILGNYINQDIKLGLDDILTAIKNAKESSNIEGIYIECGIFSASTASVQEIRDALIDFKKSNKFIIAYGGDTYLQQAYYLSTVSDKIILNPQGMFFFKGISAQAMFLKNTLEKLGVEMQIFKVGSYKSAPEIYTNDKMSDSSREQITEYVQSIWGQMLEGISKERNIPVDSLQAYANQMMAFRPAVQSLKYGLIDTLMYENDVIDLLKEKVGMDKKEKIKLASVTEVAQMKSPTFKNEKEKIAILYAVNGIDDGSSDGIKSAKIIKDLRKIREDENIKAVVLRINSPGGSAYGSEQIWQEVEKMKTVKPIVVSMGDYAASGGYYIACPASYIIAQPTTLTGSIGIFGIMPNVAGLLSKVELSFDQVNTNQFSDMPNSTRPMTEEEKTIMQLYVENGYDLLLTRCSEGRKMSKDSVNVIAQGRVWTGEKALEIGLVDELGGLSKAIEKAAELANIKAYNIINYPEKKDIFSLLVGNAENSMKNYLIESVLGEDYKSFNQVRKIRSITPVQTRLPFELVIN